MTLQTQRTALNDIKVNVQQNYQDIAEQRSKVVSNVALTCKKFAQEERDLKESLRKVNFSYRVKRGRYKTITPPPSLPCGPPSGPQSGPPIFLPKNIWVPDLNN